MENKRYISELHADHKEWISKLSFYKEEIVSFEMRLGEVARANNTKEISAQVEHFQNQFIRQGELIDELKHAIQQHEKVLSEAVETNPVASDHRYVSDHGMLREQVKTFENIYHDLKVEFSHFLSKSL